MAPAATINNELEPNNTWATANAIPSHDGALTIYGYRESESADCFRFPVLAGDTLYASVCCSGDPMLALFDPTGNMVTVDDDSGPDRMPYRVHSIPATGMWTIAVTGWPDWGFSGGGSSGWNCVASMTLQRAASSEIPEPSTWSLLAAGLAGLAAFRLRRG